MKIKRKRESARNAVDRSEEEFEMRFIKRYIYLITFAMAAHSSSSQVLQLFIINYHFNQFQFQFHAYYCFRLFCFKGTLCSI